MVSERIKNIMPSATVELNNTVIALKSQGVPIISFNIGEPDFNTPPNVIDACHTAMLAGKTKYAPVPGIMDLRKAICEKLAKDNSVHYEPTDIVVSTGAKQALMNSIMALVNPGDEVILPIPCWVSYVELIKLAGGVPVLVNTKPDFQLDLDAIKAATTDKTAAIIINTPNNPTGVLYPEEDLRVLGELAVEKNFFVISDEVYEKLVYDDKKHISIASLSPQIKDHTVIINGFSKAYAMTGWRLGYSASPKAVAKGITSLQGHMTSASTAFVQWAGVEALQGQQKSVEDMRQEFGRRRIYLLERLSKILGIKCDPAYGAFYLMPDVSYYYGKRYGDKVIEDSGDFCGYLLNEAHVATVPGKAFYAPNTIRMAYSNSMENIQKGLDAMEAALAKLV